MKFFKLIGLEVIMASFWKILVLTPKLGNVNKKEVFIKENYFSFRKYISYQPSLQSNM